jgi:hypothetical protein
MKITRENAHEVEVHQWCIDASELGLAPGDHYPVSLPTDLGNRQPFLFQHFDGNQTAVYEQQAGCLVLKVWND